MATAVYRGVAVVNEPVKHEIMHDGRVYTTTIDTPVRKPWTRENSFRIVVGRAGFSADGVSDERLLKFWEEE